MKTRVTQTDVARAAGVHNTTVSLALRNSPSIPEPTRARIRALADEMGYRPDPALQALVEYRKNVTARQTQGTLAYVTHWTTKWGWQDEPRHRDHFAGAKRLAAEYGFQLEHFWLGEDGMSPRRLERVLYHRGISGVILAAHRHDSTAPWEVDWSRLTAVKIGHLPPAPPLHQVGDDCVGVMRTALRQIGAAGFERVGFVLPEAWNREADGAWVSAFIGEHARHMRQGLVPPLVLSDAPPSPTRGADCTPAILATFDSWLQHHRPDVIVALGVDVRAHLALLGLQVPRDFALVDLSLADARSATAGVLAADERIGELATRVLVEELRRNRRGVPDAATLTLIQRTWIPGESLPCPGWSYEVIDGRPEQAHVLAAP